MNTDSVVLITGANRGIGRAIAEKLAADGYRLSLGARDPDRLREAFGPEDEKRGYFLFDAENIDSHRIWVDATLARFGSIDGLINNAGTGSKFSIEAGEEKELDRVWAVNCKSPLYMTRLCLPHLRKCGRGRIVNIASLSSKRVRNDNVAYNMTKHALIALSHGTRRIGWDDGIRVTAVCPSFVRTELTSDVTKVGRDEMIDPADLASAIAMTMALPNTAAIAELIVNCRLEDKF